MDNPAPHDARLSRYRLERLLGSGGMGSVHLAYDLSLERPVAIKFISPEKAADQSVRRRLVREARAAAALDHPNICTIYEVIDEPGGPPCIVMQYVEGETLAALLRNGPLDVRFALNIATDLASALSAAHKRRIIHRDIKPQNIIITPERRAKLVDFGVAAYYGDPIGVSADTTTADRLTQTGDVPGTPAYMSPEQVHGRQLDGRSDLFALGAVLFECLTGRRAFNGRNALELAGEIVSHDPPPVSSLRPELGEAHDELCRRLLAKDPRDRFASADELLGALQVLSTGTHQSRPADDQGPAYWRNRRVMAGIAGLLLAAVAGILALQWLRETPASPTSSSQAVIAVLPFRNETSDPANDTLAAGTTEAVGRRLAAIRSLSVVPFEEVREAARDWPPAVKAANRLPQPADAAALAKMLGAAFVVEGTVVAGESGADVLTTVVHVTGQRSGVTRHRVGARVFDLHRDIAAAVVRALSERGIVVEPPEQDAQPTSNTDAFAEYTQARMFLDRPDVAGNLAHAIRLFESAIAKDPAFALAHAGLADAYWAQFRETQDPSWTTKAMAANIDALAIDPAQPEVRMSLALGYREQGELEKAAAELQRVLDLQPANDAAYRVLSDIRARQADWPAAEDSALTAISFRPSYWRNHHQLGLIYFNSGDYDRAAAAFGRVVELQPDSARGYQSLGTALQAAGRNDEALVEYERALAISPSPRAYSNVGTLSFWRGDYRKAADAYDKATTLLPNDPELQSNLGDALSQLGQHARAVAAYRTAADQVERLLAVNPNDPQRLAALGLYRAKLGEREAAAGAIDRALSLAETNGQVLYAAALVRALAGDAGGSCAALTKALSQGASEEEVRHALELRPLTACAAYTSAMQSVK